MIVLESGLTRYYEIRFVYIFHGGQKSQNYFKKSQMSVISNLCRLCLINCQSSGILVYPNDIRREKMRDCLSIIVRNGNLYCINFSQLFFFVD